LGGNSEQKNIITMNYLLCNAIFGLICVTASHAFTSPSFEFPISRNINVIGGSHSNPNHRAITINRNIDIRITPPHRQSLLMSVEGDFDPEAISKARQEVESGSIKARVRALYKFTRPHTIRGTIFASIAGTVRALVDTPGAIGTANWSIMLPRAVVGMTALLLGNAFIVGINQIYDKEIDEMNKPFLPVASGEMSKRTAWIAVVASGVLGPILVKAFFPPLLFQLYCFGIFLGGIYSVPPIRTKKNPILAGMTIATVRGFLLNFGVYYAVKDAIGAPFGWSPKVAFIARFMVAFASVIAVTKDLPDMEGDKVRVLLLIGVVEDFKSRQNGKEFTDCLNMILRMAMFKNEYEYSFD
jgi:4-hydroxybenzoate polyprenyltransferase